MSRFPCSMCNQRVVGKLSSAYWAWFTADEERIAWKQKLCLGCLSNHFLPTLRNVNSDLTGPSICPACGGTSADDADPVYLVLYLPKADPREFELNTCAACAAKIRVSIVGQGERLENREAVVRGPSSQGPDPWAELEL